MSERPVFDPLRVRPAAPLTPPTLTPGQLNELLRGAIARHVPSTVHVVGEIGDLSRPTSGHLYFSLKDTNSEIRCVMWRSSAIRLKFALESGMEVIASGGVEVYTPRGLLQLVVRRLEPRGVGALELAFRQLRERLEREGLFDSRRKRPLPRFPERIALVTSPSGAALRDIVHTLRRRFPLAEIILFPARVQGDGAALEIAQAVRLASASAEELGIDVMIVGRGGGSLEDLWAFNEEAVARSIAASRIPVICAVGHEVDISISDLVADVRAATPTAAAEMVAPAAADLLEALERRQSLLRRDMRARLDRAAAHLKELVSREGLARPEARLNRERQWVDEALRDLRTRLSERLREHRERLSRSGMTLARVGAGALLAEARRRLERAPLRVRHGFIMKLQLAWRRLAGRAEQARRAARPEAIVRYDERLTLTLARLRSSLRGVIRHRVDRLEAHVGRLKACDPQRVLLRGYSVTRDARTGRVLRSIAEIRDGQRLRHELSDGEFRSTADDPRQPRLFE